MILLRSAIFNVWFFGATIVFGLAGMPVRWFAPRYALGVAQSWARTVLAGARVICRIRVVVSGRENLAPGAALIVSQHQSAFDTIVWLCIVPRVSYVFKAELGRIPLFGPLLVPAGQISLDRGGSFSAIRSLLRGADRAKADGRQIVIFPEGTRVGFDQDAELRPGFTAVAARIGLPVIPVATDSGRLWGRRAFRKRPGLVHILICPPVPPGLPQAALIEAVKDRWREARAQAGAVDKAVD